MTVMPREYLKIETFKGFKSNSVMKSISDGD